MKNKDLLMIGGVGLAVYMLMPKPKAEPAGVGYAVMPATEFDIGSLFGRITELFAAMPAQVIPEINIPEFKFPEIEMPELPDWEKFMPDWEKLIPAIPEELKIPDIPSLIPDIPSLIPDFLPDIFKGNGEGIAGGIVKSISGAIKDIIEIPFDIGKEVFDEDGLFSEDWWTAQMPEWALTSYGKFQREEDVEAKAIFAEAGISEVTPETLSIFRQARETITGEKRERIPPIGTPEYDVYMGLAPKSFEEMFGYAKPW